MKSITPIDNKLLPVTANLVLVFDTETTGLIDKSVLDIYKKPYVIQLSYILYDETTNTNVETYNEYIRLSDLNIVSEKTTQITGITKQKLDQDGIPITDALVSFYQAYKKCKRVVAHNLKFDKEILLTEIERNYHEMVELGCLSPECIFNDLYNRVYDIECYDTMEKSVDICNILKPSSRQGMLCRNEVLVENVRMYKKYPTLSELSQCLYGEVPEGLHNAMNDVQLCLKCYKTICSGEYGRKLPPSLNE
jgi:DNA polymerase III epsilon subunit-like protein